MKPKQKRPYDEHNRRVLEKLNRGDLIKFHRRGYFHWAVYCGDNNVIHLQEIEHQNGHSNVFSVGGERFSIAVVDDFWRVASGCKAEKDNYLDDKYRPYDPDDIVEIAMKMTEIGELPFSLGRFNCEHFATFCRYGTEHSQQAELLKKFLGEVGLLAVEGIADLYEKLQQRRRQCRLREECIVL